MKKRAAAYIRVSTDEQTEYSPDAQKKALQQYAKSNNMTLLNDCIYIDEGISGRKAEKRPAFMKMISDAKSKNKPFDVILVHKFDRFARNREDSVIYKSILRKQCGIKVISITENIEDDKISILIEPMLEALAEYYSVNLSEEVKKGMTEKATRGEYQTTAAYGYKWINGVLTVDEKEAEHIKYIFDRFIADLPKIQISKNLNELGARTHRGNTFETRSIDYILKNPLYCGYTRWSVTGKENTNNDTLIVKGCHQPIISEDIFNKAQEKLNIIKSARTHKSRPATEYKHYVSGMVHCSNCGATLSYMGKSNSLQCWKYNHAKCNVSHSIQISKIEKAIDDELKFIINNNNISKYEISSTSTNKELNILSSKLSNQKNRLSRLESAYLDGVFDLVEFKIKKEEINKYINDINNEISLIGNKDFVKDVIDIYSILHSEAFTTLEKNTALKSVIEKIVFNKSTNELEFYYYF